MRLTFALAMACATTAAVGQTKLEQEAGICAYMNAGRSLNPAQIKARFRTVEAETAEYLVGSLALPDYTEQDDVHVYVHRDGWIAAYYLKDDPVSKIMDLVHYQGGQMTSTKLDIALGLIAEALGVPPVDIKYYYFPAPQANRLLLVVDRESRYNTADSFELTIPVEITVFEKSWGFYTDLRSGTGRLSVGGQVVPTDSGLSYGKLALNLLERGTPHTVEVYNQGSDAADVGGVALVLLQP
jgi:hypothetical protein